MRQVVAEVLELLQGVHRRLARHVQETIGIDGGEAERQLALVGELEAVEEAGLDPPPPPLGL